MAVDPSDGQLAYARQRPGAKAAEFRAGDARNLLFGDDSFDAAVMALVIAFLSDPLKAVSEMTRVVRPGGWVATYMWDGSRRRRSGRSHLSGDRYIGHAFYTSTQSSSLGP